MSAQMHHWLGWAAYIAFLTFAFGYVIIPCAVLAWKEGWDIPDRIPGDW